MPLFSIIFKQQMGKVTRQSKDHQLSKIKELSTPHNIRKHNRTLLMKFKFISKNQIRQLSRNRLKQRKYSDSQTESSIETECYYNDYDHQYSNNIAKMISIDHFKCPLCLELLISPVINTCGHYLCLDCAQHYEDPHSRCLVCRQSINISEARVSESATNLVLAFIKNNLSPEAKEVYDQRRVDFEICQKSRKLSQHLTIGTLLDFKDPVDNKWKEGRIIGFSMDEGYTYYGQINLIVQPLYSIRNQKFIFRMTSNSIAKFKSYTQKNIFKKPTLEEIQNRFYIYHQYQFKNYSRTEPTITTNDNSRIPYSCSTSERVLSKNQSYNSDSDKNKAPHLYQSQHSQSSQIKGRWSNFQPAIETSLLNRQQYFRTTSCEM